MRVRRNLKVAGECKWTSTPMPKRVLDDLREFKLPAIAQEGRLKVPAAGPEIVLFARSWFAPELVAEANADERVTQPNRCARLGTTPRIRLIRCGR